MWISFTTKYHFLAIWEIIETKDVHNKQPTLDSRPGGERETKLINTQLHRVVV